MNIEKIPYKSFPNCYRLANQQVELVVASDIGPRVLRFAWIGGDNQFHEFAAAPDLGAGQEWQIYGGHRFWHAPEAIPRSYAPDNDPVDVEERPGFIRLVQPIEASTGIQKELTIALAPDSPHAVLTHRLRNTNLWEVELAAWALTVMALGGVGIMPLPEREAHGHNLTPTSSLAIWSYTDLSDPRFTWGNQYILLRQAAQPGSPQKIGLRSSDGWLAYARAGDLFVKRFGFDPSAAYPDLGCNAELFTRFDMLELESLGPLTRLPPGACLEHVERWYLFQGVQPPSSDADVQRDIFPLIEAVG